MPPKISSDAQQGALLSSTLANDLEDVNALLGEGVCPNFIDGGVSPTGATLFLSRKSRRGNLQHTAHLNNSTGCDCLTPCPSFANCKVAAAENAYVGILKALLEHGADPNAVRSEPHCRRVPTNRHLYRVL